MLLRSSVIVIFALLTIGKINAQQVANSNGENRPNIIFILTDDQRWDALGYAGNELVTTPQMDDLARSGTYFKNAMVTTPICAASRASILTGLYERTHAYTFQSGPVKEEYMNQAYPKLLKEAGYQTAFFGKLGVNYDDKEILFDVYEDYDRSNDFSDRRGYFYKTLDGDTVHLTRYTGQKALDFIDATNGKPFCLSLSFSAPHAHDRAEDQYFWQSTTDPLLQDVEIPKAAISSDKYFERLPQSVKDGFNRVRWGWRYDTPDKYQHSVKGYYRMIAGIDLEIAKIREQLEAKGIADNTVIILMGDNGYFLGERQLAGKWLMYDNSVRVPLIVYDPRIKKHQDLDDMALNIDVPSTILDLAGLQQPPAWHGKSLMPVVSGQAPELQRDTVLIEHLWEFERIPPSEGVRTADWKYFRYVNDKTIEELYDLNKDPLEIKNLAGKSKYADVLTQLRKKTDELTLKYRDLSTAGPQELTVEYLRQPSKTPIIDPTPEFGWKVPQEAIYQSAYQILVASSKEFIDLNNGDVWNSDRVSGNNSTNATYQGKPLVAGKEYYWKVRIWDERNRLGAYSDPQLFRMSNVLEEGTSTPNFNQIIRVNPQEMNQISNGSYFIDFGKAAFATLELDYEASEPHTLIVRLGESVLNNSVDRNPGASIRYQEVQVPVTPSQKRYQIDLQPDERNTMPDKAIALPDSFPVLMPFRYCEIENANTPLEKQDITQVAYINYFDDNTSSFSSNSEVLDQIYDLCKYSMKATTFAGLYIDGDRERIPYEADAYINQLGHYNTDREYAMARRTIEYFMKHPTWPTEWQQHVALLFYADYMYTGNTELIEKYYEDLKYKTLYGLANEDGLISSENVTHEFMLKLGFEEGYKKPLTDIVDWPSANFNGSKTKGERDGFVFKPYNTVVNAFYYQNMKIMAVFADVLEKPEEVSAFELRAAKAKKSINEQLFDQERGVYVDGIGTDHASLHANMMPLAFGLVPKKHLSSVVSFIKSRGMACSVYGSQFLMDGLYDAGEEKYALQLLTSNEKRSWYNMIREGSTITMEAWGNEFKNNQDWNHAWGGVPANVIPRGLWGIQPKVPGFKIAQIKPQLATLSSSTIEVPTLLGSIHASYQKEGRVQTYKITLPANMLGEFVIVDSGSKSVTLNGEKVFVEYGTVRLQPGLNEIQLKINSF